MPWSEWILVDKGLAKWHSRAVIPYEYTGFVEFIVLIIATFHIPCRHALHANTALWYIVSKMFIHTTKYKCTQARGVYENHIENCYTKLRSFHGGCMGERSQCRYILTSIYKFRCFKFPLLFMFSLRVFSTCLHVMNTNEFSHRNDSFRIRNIHSTFPGFITWYGNKNSQLPNYSCKNSLLGVDYIHIS